MCIGKYAGLSAMLVCQRAVALAGHVGGLDVYCTLLRESRTVMIDVLALLRSTKTLQWVRKNKVLCEGEKLTKELPVLFEAAGIPAPTLGSGLLWRYKHNTAGKLIEFQLHSMMDNRLQLRLFLDTTIPRLRHAIQVYRKKNTGVEEEEEDEEEEKEEDKEEDKYHI